MTLDERLHHVIKMLDVAERVTGGSFFEERQAVEEARALLRANLTPGFMCGACGVFTGTAKENHQACRACGKERT